MPLEALRAHRVLGAAAGPNAARDSHARLASALAAEAGIELPPLPVGWP
jgi:hypothetical protein